jgi:hypothetical protein
MREVPYLVARRVCRDLDVVAKIHTGSSRKACWSGGRVGGISHRVCLAQ